MTNKKNGFWRFCFSLIPGAGEMYMGFMKLGVSTMGLFVGIIALTSWVGLGPLVCLDFIVWFYSFFQVHHLASLPPDRFIQVEDDYLFHLEDFGGMNRETLQRFRQPVAIVLILVGIMLCYQSLYSMVWRVLPPFLQDLMNYLGYSVPRLLFGLLIIYAGVRLIQGKRLEMGDEEYYGETISAGSHGGSYSDFAQESAESRSASFGYSCKDNAASQDDSQRGKEEDKEQEEQISSPENLRTVIYMPSPEEGSDGKEKQ